MFSEIGVDIKPTPSVNGRPRIISSASSRRYNWIFLNSTGPSAVVRRKAVNVIIWLAKTVAVPNAPFIDKGVTAFLVV